MKPNLLELVTDTFEIELLHRLRMDKFEGVCTSIYIGGGTPSLWAPHLLEKLLVAIRTHVVVSADCEVTIEVNPEDATSNYFSAWSALGINRVSIGAQSFDDDILRLLGRAHQASEIEQTVDLCHRVGINNVSIDLIHGIRTQTLARALKDLQRAHDLAVEHISIYQLTVEPGTRFGTRADRGEVLVVSDEELSHTYRALQDVNEAAGYEQYEVSNAAKSGYRSRHNLGYWHGQTCLAIGPGAHGLVKLPNRLYRYHNPRSVSEYLKTVQDVDAGLRSFGQNHLSVIEYEEELIMTGLRLKDGFLPTRAMQERLGEQFELMETRGLLCQSGNRWCATARGREVLNYVLGQLLC